MAELISTGSVKANGGSITLQDNSSLIAVADSSSALSQSGDAASSSLTLNNGSSLTAVSPVATTANKFVYNGGVFTLTGNDRALTTLHGIDVTPGLTVTDATQTTDEYWQLVPARSYKGKLEFLTAADAEADRLRVKPASGGPFTAPPLTASATPANDTIRAGFNSSFGTTTTGGLAPLIYQWQMSTDGGSTYTDVTTDYIADGQKRLWRLCPPQTASGG